MGKSEIAKLDALLKGGGKKQKASYLRKITTAFNKSDQGPDCTRGPIFTAGRLPCDPSHPVSHRLTGSASDLAVNSHCSKDLLYLYTS